MSLSAIRWASWVIASALLWLSSPVLAAAPVLDCGALAGRALPLPDPEGDFVATLATAVSVPAGALRAHCRVDGVITQARPPADRPASRIGFFLQLPADWNGKLAQVGGGGYVGSYVNVAPTANQLLALRYATAGTDTGHTGKTRVDGWEYAPQTFLDASWAVDHPEALRDFAYRAVHLTTIAAKAVVAEYYGGGPALSYFLGCSNGGRQALVEAQRFPDDFDGIVAGDPSYDMNASVLTMNWNTYWADQAPIAPGRLPFIERGVLADCDAKDGLLDGLVQDPRRCTFDPGALLACSAPGDPCFSSAQVDTVRMIYAGPHDRAGRPLAEGRPQGGEGGASGWPLWITGGSLLAPDASWRAPDPYPSIGPVPVRPPNGFTASNQFFRYMVFNGASSYRPFPDSEPFAFRVDALPPAFFVVGQMLGAADPDLRAFKARGGKLIMYQGWNDSAISALDVIRYYRDAIRAMRVDPPGEGDPPALDHVTEFFRFFLAPGMHHCFNGPGLTTFDALSALASWVEQGVPPDRIVASGPAMPGRTRPLCPYPQEAVYSGSGSIESAASFACVATGPPRADARPDGAVLECTSPAGATVALDGTRSVDPEPGNTLAFAWQAAAPLDDRTSATPSGTFGLGAHAPALTVTTPLGAFAVDSAGFSVVDTTPPDIACNAHPITPRSTPIAFEATATDTCGPASVSATAFDCWKQNGAGKRIGKLDSCAVRLDGPSVTILDSGGVGDHIEWTVTARDPSGNVASRVCAIEVLHP